MTSAKVSRPPARTPLVKLVTTALDDMKAVNVKVLDVRTREEHEAALIPGSQLVTQDLIQEIFASWDKSAPVIIYDHQGDRSLDAVAIGKLAREADAATRKCDAD